MPCIDPLAVAFFSCNICWLGIDQTLPSSCRKCIQRSRPHAFSMARKLLSLQEHIGCTDQCKACFCIPRPCNSGWNAWTCIRWQPRSSYGWTIRDLSPFLHLVVSYKDFPAETSTWKVLEQCYFVEPLWYYHPVWSAFFSSKSVKSFYPRMDALLPLVLYVPACRRQLLDTNQLRRVDFPCTESKPTAIPESHIHTWQLWYRTRSFN